MDQATKELMDRAREADRLPPAALERMSQSLQLRLERGDAPLSGIDAAPVLQPQPALVGKLLTAGGGGLKLALGVGLGIATGAVLWTLTGSEPRAEEARVSEAARAREMPAPVESTEARRAPAREDRHVGQAAPSTDAKARSVPLVAPSMAAPERIEPASVRPTRRTVHTSASLADRSHARATPSTHARDGAPREVSRAPVVAAAVHDTQAQAERTAPEPPASPVAAVDAEFMLLQGAYAELSAGHPARAFPILDEHARRFPNGALSESREVARMLALCATGQITDARIKADEFLARYPSSTYRARVQRMCPLKSAQPTRP